MERYDVAVIGTGPAGVSAAITAKVRGKSVLLLGQAAGSPKLIKAHAIQNYPGLPGIDGADLAAAYRCQLAEMQIPVTDTRVTAVYAMGDYFALQTADAMPEARTVILATGVVMEKPLPGEAELLGRGVSYCATCDAHFYKGKTVAVVGYNAESCAEADFLAETAETVLYFPAVKHEITVTSPKIRVIEECPTAVLGTLKAQAVQTARAEYPVDGVFILREAVAPGQLVPGLQTDGPHAVVDLQMCTNLPGLFACGDIAGKPYQYIKAAGQGNVAALSAVAYLARQNKKEK